MLDLPRYLLGVVELAWLGGFAWLGGTALRLYLLPSFTGAPAHLATSVLSLAILIWAAELLGSFGLLEPVPYLLAVALSAVAIRALLRRVARRRGPPVAEGAAQRRPSTWGRAAATGPAGRRLSISTLIALAIALAAVIHFGLDVRTKLSTGMTGFDSTWYHAPFAAGFFQSGNTWQLHFIAPQFLAWFYPANAEIFHAAGMLAFGRDLLSPLLNLGWFAGCLVACWCIGRPYGVAPWSLALGAIALSLPVLSDQAGEARNDIVGIFFLLCAVAIALNVWQNSARASSSAVTYDRIANISHSGALVVGLAAGLAAGTKLNFLLPAAVLVLGAALVSPAGRRWHSLVVALLGAIAGGGYWYLRNLVHSGSPLPWFDHLGPISLPAPEQALGGREGHSVLGYLTDGAIWSDWFLPGLHGGLTILWPPLLALALGGLLLCLFVPARSSPGVRVAALAGLAAILAWLIAPTSASGPDGMPRGFESGLRYLAPAIVLGFALLPTAGPLTERLRGFAASLHFPVHIAGNHRLARGVLVALVGVGVSVGYLVQRHYLEDRYVDPTFAAPGLNAAFAWADDVSGARIATTSTRQYPLFGADLSNRVQFVGEPQPHGGFTSPTTCQRWRRLLDAGDYDYVVTSRDRLEPGKPPYPPTTRWTEGPQAEIVLRKPPTAVFKLKGSLAPSACNRQRSSRGWRGAAVTGPAG